MRTTYSLLLTTVIGRERTPRFRRLTVYSGVLTRHQAVQASARTENKSVFRLNFALMIAAGFSVALYIFISNFLVAQRYALDARKAQLNQLNTKPVTEEQYDTASDLKELLIFARKSGMVEAKETDSILQKEGFAITTETQN